MRARDFILEGKLKVSKNDLGPRIFYSAKVDDSQLNWIQQAMRRTVDAEATVDINNNQAYINRIDSYISGQGIGTELLEYILDDLASQGITSVSTYIENSNVSSRSLFRRVGFQPDKQTEYGQYWVNS